MGFFHLISRIHFIYFGKRLNFIQFRSLGLSFCIVDQQRQITTHNCRYWKCLFQKERETKFTNCFRLRSSSLLVSFKLTLTINLLPVWNYKASLELSLLSDNKRQTNAPVWIFYKWVSWDFKFIRFLFRFRRA